MTLKFSISFKEVYRHFMFSDCERLKEPANGTLSTREAVPHGKNLTVSCKEHFSLTGNKTLTCSSGHWSGQVGKCEPGENIKMILHLLHIHVKCVVNKQTCSF